MTAYLICEDGPHAGQQISLTEGNEWVIGRDPDVSFQVLEDPMVSRKHVLIHLENDVYFLENLSTVNPTYVNDAPLEKVHKLEENDIIQIGNNYFRFSTQPLSENIHDESAEEEEHIEAKEESFTSGSSLSTLAFGDDTDKRWIIKVISGPNQGAEFAMDEGQNYTIGKDPEFCDIIFQDLSVSKDHARLTIDDSGEAFIEDLESRNGTLLNGHYLEERKNLHSGDSITLGTTTFLFIDRQISQETIYSPASIKTAQADEESEEKEVIKSKEPPEDREEYREKNWKKTFIPTRHLVVASIFSLAIFVGFVSMLALFKSQTVMPYGSDPRGEIREITQRFTDVQFTYNQGSGKIFLVGHVLTDIDHRELLYLIRSLPFIRSIKDNVVVDQGVWQSMNAMLSKNPTWRSVMITATKPGHFVLRGYLETEEEADKLQEYINLNFPYLNLLDNQVVVENILFAEVQSILTTGGYSNVTFQFNNGEIVFSGRVGEKQQDHFESILDEISEIKGIRQIRNFVIFTGTGTARIDLTSKYQVNGTSKFGNTNQFVLINGRILGKGETLDGMMITDITSDEVLLDRDGMKYKIDYNQQ